MSHIEALQCLENEVWWGGLVEDGIIMPFGNQAITRDLTVNTTSNQGMPLLLSNKGRYVWSDTGFAYSIDNQTLKIESQSPIIVDHKGTHLQDVYKYVSEQYFKADGKIPFKRLFTSPQYNTWIELMYDQEEEAILDYAKKIIEKGMPKGVLMIDDNWQEDYGVWEFSGTRFNDPKKMVQQIHDMGFDVMLWVCPFISADSATARDLASKNILLKDKDGNIAIRQWWNGYSAVLDLTNPDAREWFRQRLDYLCEEYGIDGFKFDAGDARFYRDDDQTFIPEASANDQCHYFNNLGLDFELNEFRAAWKNAGLGLAQRLCDKNHTWDNKGLASLIPNGLAQGLLGYSFTCPDMIGGGEYLNFLDSAMDLDEELVVRYAQCSALFPMMQFSAAPWRVLSHENFLLCKNAAELHVKYADYIYSLAEHASKTGDPILRHMAYQYPDGGFEHTTSQFMLGNELLVAPVTVKGDITKEIHFPEGTWKGDDESVVNGPCAITVEAPLNRLPYYQLIK
ncbi:glycoside hydrolase family 31 protein [Vallitalea okinawensis]|uniref:glycoside hydrolase family 31 protein n=1 Tax=Vallitalea okinawensis TaxID=2078660 RepID=UPI000CFBD4B6|nr:glycoside hydrolase family 31 protein [Vallitalea okinawensis]